MKGTKLYRLTTSQFCAFSHSDKRGQVLTTPADNVPMIRWPDGRWCLLANFFMQQQYKAGFSRKGGGGTLLIYAGNLSPLIRFCYKNKTDFIDLTDSQFTFFIKTLQGERRSKDPEVMIRDANSVIAIGRKCLDFLSYVGRHYNEDEFVGTKGRIKAEMKEHIIIWGKGFKKKKMVRIYWYHHSFPSPDPKKKGLPISTENVAKLREAVLPASNSSYLRKRRYVMLMLLEITGARRIEIVALTVDSVRAAARMEEPMLKFETAKRRKGKVESRLIPVSRHDIEFLLEFIDKNRRLIIKKTCGFENDEGGVLVSETTGKRLRPNTITQEVSILSKEARIDEKSCPKMFRHRFVTKMFVALIARHKFENVDDFRKALLDQEAFKKEIQEWTGHTHLSSLDTYIHLAFLEAANYKKTYSLVSATRLVESMSRTMRQINAELKAGVSPAEAALQLEKFIDAALIDLERLSQCET